MNSNPNPNTQTLSPRRRLANLEQGMVRATMDVGNTAIPGLTDDGTWISQTSARMALTNLSALNNGNNDIQQVTSGVTTAKLSPGKWKVTLAPYWGNGAANNANIRFGLIDDQNNVFFDSGANHIKVAASTDESRSIAHTFFLTLTKATTVFYCCSTNAAGDSISHVQGGVSRIVFEKVSD